MKPKWLCILALFLLTGCYTQFSSLDRYAAMDGGYVDSQADSVQENKSDPDTVVVTEREHCYWHQSFWGEPVLRCYKTTYDYNWYSFYNRPWWFRSSYYGRYDRYDYGCSCPYHSYYHTNCRYCWERCDRRCYDCDQSPSGQTGGSGGAISRPPGSSGHTGGGQVIQRGRKPLIAGPRPDVVKKPVSKKTSNEAAKRTEPVQSNKEGSSSVSSPDSSRVPAIQPRRHFGRGR